MSGRKLSLPPYKVLTAQQILNGLTSLATHIPLLDNISYQANFSGTPTGTLAIQGSLDWDKNFLTGEWITAKTVAIAAAGNVLINLNEIAFPWVRLIYTPTGAAVQTVAPIADTGVKQSQTVTSVADSAGSLNNTYFLLSSVNTTSKAQKNFYMWFNINSAGTDPALAGKTGIPITGATNASANTLATSMRTALNALTGDFTAAGSNAAVIVTNVAFGPVTAAVDGAVPTGFTFGAATAGVASNLNNKYFTLNSGNNTDKYYVWMNVDAIGTAPAPAGLTAIEVDFSSGASAATIGTAMATAIAAANTSADFSTSGTTTVTVTNLQTGPATPAADSASAPTGFTFALTTGSGLLTAYVSGKML